MKNVRQTLFLFSFFLVMPFLITANESAASKQVSSDFTSVAKKAVPAVVSIQVKTKDQRPQSRQNFRGFEDDAMDPFGEQFWEHFFGPSRRRMLPEEPPQYAVGQASGFIASPDGYILTNNHVVKNAGQISVILNDGREFDATVIGQDPNTDLAVIKIDGKNLPHINLGNSDYLEVGQWVVAIGNPLGLQASLTVGVVSAKGRNNLDLVRIEDFIQTDAAINRGNSGGPLLNLNGDVVGINTAIVSNMSSGGYMGIGFAIPSNMARHVMDELIQSGSVARGFMGITLQNVDQDLAAAFDLNKVEGALVAEVHKDSPAASAGIQQGDIILEYDNIKVPNIAALRNAVALKKPGTAITLSILRDKQTVKIPVTLAAFPGAGEKTGDIQNKLGFEVEDITPEIAKTLGLLQEKGVIINKVQPGSIAAWAGLKKGALILAVNRKKIETTQQFYQFLENSGYAKPLLLLIKQDDVTRYISLKVGN